MYLIHFICTCMNECQGQYACVGKVQCVSTFSSILSSSKCASVAAHYELREVFDNLIISLCKFTTLLNTHEVCVYV